MRRRVSRQVGATPYLMLLLMAGTVTLAGEQATQDIASHPGDDEFTSSVAATAGMHQPPLEASIRWIYRGCRGTQHLAGQRGTTIYPSAGGDGLAALVYAGVDGSGIYLLYRVDEHGLEQEQWAFAKNCLECYGHAVWRYYDSNEDGNFEWVFQNFANRRQATSP